MFLCLCVCVYVCVCVCVFTVFSISFSFSWIRIVRGLAISLVLSHHNKNLKHHSPRTDQCYSSVLQLSFILKVKENTSSRTEGMPIQKIQKERPPAQFWLLFLYVIFFLLPLGLPFVNWASQECCLFYLGPHSGPWTFLCSFFCRLFPSLTFSHAILDSFFLL